MGCTIIVFHIIYAKAPVGPGHLQMIKFNWVMLHWRKKRHVVKSSSGHARYTSALHHWNLRR